MATLNWQTPNSTTGSIDLSKISLDDGSFTIHAKNTSSDYTLVGSHDHPDGRLVWNGRYFKVGPNSLASIAETANGDAVFYNNTQDEEGGTSGTARLYGSPTFDTCASVVVYGIDHPINPGKFVLYARTASDTYALVGNPEDRTLYWNSSPVLTTQSDLAASKITGAVPIANGGTGATTRLNAAKNLLNENVGANATYFLTMTNNFANMGYSSIADAKTVLGISSDYLPLSGGTLTGNLTISKTDPRIHLDKNNITRGTAPSAAVNTIDVLARDSADKSVWGIYSRYGTDKSNRVDLICYKGTTNDGTWAGIGVGYDGSGNAYTYAPTPSTTDRTTKIATTSFVGSVIANSFTIEGKVKTVTIEANSVVSSEDTLLNVAKTGYHPIGVVGWKLDGVNSTYCTVSRICKASSSMYSSNEVFMTVRNPTSKSVTIEITYHILYVKTQ